MSIPSKPASHRSEWNSCSVERAGDAADPELHARPDLGRHLAPDHDVGHREPAARLEHPERFGDHLPLVGREVDDAVGDDHVHRVVGERDGLDLALEELDVLDAGLALVLAGQGQHLVGHVEAVRLAGGADPPGREQHVDAAAGAQVEHHLALVQLGQRRGVAAAQRGQHGLGREARGLGSGVEVGGDRVVGCTCRRSRRSRSDWAPVATRSAAWPYRSRTVVLMSSVLI